MAVRVDAKERVELEPTIGPVLIFGKGLVGSYLAAEFSASTALNHQEADILDQGKIEELIAKFPGHVVINAAGKTNVDAAETENNLGDRSSFYQVNVLGNEIIAAACKKYGKFGVFFGSEMVFPGDNPQKQYSEDEIPDPGSPLLGHYAVTKALGELALLDAYKNGGDFIEIRISHPSKKGAGWFYKMIKYPTLHQDSLISPTLVEEIPQVIQAAVTKRKTGIWHVVATAGTPLEIAKYGRTRLGITEMPKAGRFENLPNRAPRPQYGVLSREKTQRELGVNLRTWQEQVDFLTS